LCTLPYFFCVNVYEYYILSNFTFKATKPRVVIVSSGGMLTQRLNLDDLQSEKAKKFDGTTVYAQNKRQQVIMCEQYARKYPEIFFAAMHPGWADTPAVRSSMPGFYEKMKGKLRSAEEGADTAVWLCAAERAIQEASGLFFQGEQPLGWIMPPTGYHVLQTQFTP
jgi:dehydrogenase/reductase SDR family protein 12